MTGLVTKKASQPRMANSDIANAFIFAVEAMRPDKHTTERREKRLRNAAHAIMQLWDDMQAEKTRRRREASTDERDLTERIKAITSRVRKARDKEKPVRLRPAVPELASA